MYRYRTGNWIVNQKVPFSPHAIGLKYIFQLLSRDIVCSRQAETNLISRTWFEINILSLGCRYLYSYIFVFTHLSRIPVWGVVICYDQGFITGVDRDKLQSRWKENTLFSPKRMQMNVSAKRRPFCCKICLTQWGRDKMAAVSQTTFSSAFLWMKMFKFLWISLKFVSKGPIDNIPALVQIMAWRWHTTSHYLKQWWLDYRRIFAALRLNELNLLVRNPVSPDHQTPRYSSEEFFTDFARLFMFLYITQVLPFSIVSNIFSILSTLCCYNSP